jgi:hypothetical protein
MAARDGWCRQLGAAGIFRAAMQFPAEKMPRHGVLTAVQLRNRLTR